MIVVRNSFQLKFGKAKEAIAALKEAVAAQKKAGATFDFRLLSDLSGPFYILVLEITLPSLTALETEMPRNMAAPEFQAAYQKFVQLVESGQREIYTIVG